MVNQSVNEVYTQFLLKIDALPHDVVFPLYIAAIFFNNLIPDVREFLISDVVQVPSRPPTENNHQGNQRRLVVRNLAVEAENNTRTIKASVQPARGISHPKTFMGMIAGNPSKKWLAWIVAFNLRESTLWWQKQLRNMYSILQKRLTNIKGNMRQWDSWRKEEDFMMKFSLTCGIISTPHLPSIVSETIPTGWPPQFTWVFQKRP